MDQCPICEESLHDALVICGYCGEELPLRVVVVSEGSRGNGGFALVTWEQGSNSSDEQEVLTND